MKKTIIPLLMIIALTGCSKINNKTTNYVDVINDIISYDNKKVNTSSYGYNYYLPIGVNVVYDGKLNKEFKVKDNKLMLYVDVVSYFYKNSLNYEFDNTNSYYYSKLNNGYILINEEDNTYYLKIIYNYAKIESYVKKEDLVDVISYSTIILNSISYNDNLISNIIEKGENYNNEITYEIDKPNNSESKFREYLQEYVQENKEETNSILPED